MMDETDKQRFRELIEELGNMYGQEVGPKYAPYWRVLSARMDIETMANAVDAHMADPQRGRFFPTPADLLHQCRDPRFIHPAADAAWAIALESMDEQASVILTPEIMQARSAALPVWESGDRIGARMAFRAAYEQVLLQSNTAPRWQFSPGHDPQRRAEAAQRALDQGLLPREKVRRYLPGPSATADGEAIAGLLTGNVVSHPAAASESVKARLAAVRRAISSGREEELERRTARRNQVARERQERRHGAMTDEERAANLAAAIARLDSRQSGTTTK